MSADRQPAILLLPVIQRVFPIVSSLYIVETIEQASAVGYVVQLQTTPPSSHEDWSPSSSSPSTLSLRSIPVATSRTNVPPQRIFLKHIQASCYVHTKKDWEDLRRSLLYARTEARFYQEFAPILKRVITENHVAATTTRTSADSTRTETFLPTIYHTEYDFTDWIGEDETGHEQNADPTIVKELLPQPANRGATIIMEYLSPERYIQDSPLTITQCHESLTAVARLHAAAWEERSLLQRAENRLSRYSFHLSMRNPKELAGIEQAWEHFCTDFGPDLRVAGAWNDTIIPLMGRRIKSLAVYISEQLSVQCTDPFTTLVHGDYKSMNVFLPRHDDTYSREDSSNEGSRPAILVDFASVGIGLGVCDVAMHVHHAIVPEQLDQNDGEERLLRYYFQALQQCLAQQGKAEASKRFTWDILLRQYRYAVVDYYRFFLGRFWKSASHDSMHKLRDNKNTNLINRSVPAAIAFVTRVNKYLTTIEDEYRINNTRPSIE